MEERKYLLLDAFVLSETSKTEFAEQLRNYILDQRYTILLHVMNLVETHRASHKFPAICDFLSQVPFVIAANPEVVLEAEIQAYPNHTELPINFDSAGYSKASLAYALGAHLKKLDKFHRSMAKINLEVREEIRANCQKSVDAGFNLEVHLLVNFLPKVARLNQAAFRKLRAIVARGEAIDLSIFKGGYLQEVALYTEFAKHGKSVKESDLGDFFQLAFVPYAALSVVDNERVDMIRKINKLAAVPEKYNVLRMSEFRQTISA